MNTQTSETNCWACGYPASQIHGPAGCPALPPADQTETYHRDYPTAADLQAASVTNEGSETCPTHGTQLIIGADAERIGLACGCTIPNVDVDEDAHLAASYPGVAPELAAEDEEDHSSTQPEDLEGSLVEAIRELLDWDVSTFRDAMVLTGNSGLVIRTPDLSEFQLTIVKSR